MDIERRDAQLVFTSARETRMNGVAEFAATYRPIGAVLTPKPGSLEYFLAERYCLYTVDKDFRAKRLDIHHSPWPLQVAEATIAVNTMAEAAGVRLPSTAPLLHFVRRQDMVAWALRDAD